VLNLGFNEFIKKADGSYLQSPFQEPQKFRCMVRDATFTTNAQGAGTPVAGDWVPSSEPLKLALDGTRLPVSQPALNLTYRNPNELNYASIGIGS
jgi:hypothetical protein